MSDVSVISSRISELDVSPQFQPYSKVVINTKDNGTAIVAGDDTGRTLEVTNPFGTQDMANRMLASLRGRQYQPYDAKGALLNPAAEIGDGITMRGNYGGLYKRSLTFNRLMKADIAAPVTEEINHEYKYEDPTVRKFIRQLDEVNASLVIANDSIRSEVKRVNQWAFGSDSADPNYHPSQTLTSQINQTAEEISANVVKINGTGDISSFGWWLGSDSHRWYANNKEVMRVTSEGLTVIGSIYSEDGTIGGFTITKTKLYNGVTSMNDTSHNGVYVGTDGIRLGKGNFSVTSSGVLTAKSALLENAQISGTLKVDGVDIGASILRLGAQAAYNNKDTWNGTTNTVNNGAGGWSSATNTVNSYSGNWNSAHTSACTTGGFCYSGTTKFNNAQITGGGALTYFESGGLAARGYFVSHGAATFYSNVSVGGALLVGGSRCTWITFTDLQGYSHTVLGVS